MSGISSSQIVLVLSCDWTASPGSRGICAFDDVQVTDGTNVLGDDTEGDPGWRINIQSTSEASGAYNPPLQIILNIANIVFPARANGVVTFKNMNVSPAITQTSDPFGSSSLPSTYNINNVSVAGLGAEIWSNTITKDGDWEWAVTLAIAQDNVTKTFAADPEMEVGDLGMSAAV